MIQIEHCFFVVLISFAAGSPASRPGHILARLQQEYDKETKSENHGSVPLESFFNQTPQPYPSYQTHVQSGYHNPSDGTTQLEYRYKNHNYEGLNPLIPHQTRSEYKNQDYNEQLNSPAHYQQNNHNYQEEMYDDFDYGMLDFGFGGNSRQWGSKFTILTQDNKPIWTMGGNMDFSRSPFNAKSTFSFNKPSLFDELFDD